MLVGPDGDVLVKAHRGERPKRHAEFCLLEKAQELGIDTSTCTLFVTLEPCIKRGKTKVPCAVRVGDAGIKKVFIGTLDPDPRITGRGEMYLTYQGIDVEHFPPELASELRDANKHFFDRFRAAHFWNPPPLSLYGAAGHSVAASKPLLANSREGLLHQTLDLMLSTQGDIWINAGNLSWFRELQVGFLAASLDGREVRVMHQVEKSPTDVSTVAHYLGANICKLTNPATLRFTLFGPRTGSAAVVSIDRSNTTLLRSPNDEGLIEVITDWFESRWVSADVIHSRPVSIKKIKPEDVLKALRTHVPQYRNAKIEFEEVSLAEVKPATQALESFKLFRITQFGVLRERYDLPELAKIDGSPWPLINYPVVERLPDGQMIVIDGTHRTYSARARGTTSIEAIVVDNPNFDLPSQPPLGWEHIEIMPNKLERKARYKNFDENLFRPIRKAFESLTTTSIE